MPWLMLWFCDVDTRNPGSYCMPRLNQWMAGLVLLPLLLPAPADAGSLDQAAVFEQMKGLAGLWRGHREDPLNGPPVTVRYEVVANGRALLEIQDPGQSWSTLTVYALARGELEATHFSPAGNQPRWRLSRKSTAELLLLELAGGRGFDAGEDGHVRGGEFRFVAPDRIERSWYHYVGPKRLGTTQWFLQREPTPAKESTP